MDADASRGRREIIAGEGAMEAALRPMRIEARWIFATAYRKARLWVDQMIADRDVSVASLAVMERRTERSIRQTLSLAFLDPTLVSAALEGRLPRGFGLKRLMDLPVDWPEQWSQLGLGQPAERA